MKLEADKLHIALPARRVNEFKLTTLSRTESESPWGATRLGRSTGRKHVKVWRHADALLAH